MLGEAARYEKGPPCRSVFRQAAGGGEQGGLPDEGSWNGAPRNGMGQLVGKGEAPVPG